MVRLLIKECIGKKKFKTIEIYRDLLVIFAFFGNDFIPAMKNIKIDEYNIDILFASHIIIMHKYNKTFHDYLQ